MLCWYTMHGMQDVKQLTYRDKTEHLVNAIHYSLMGAVNSVAGLPNYTVTEQRYRQQVGSYLAFSKIAYEHIEILQKHYSTDAYTQHKFSPLPHYCTTDQTVTNYIAGFNTYGIGPLKKQVAAMQAIVPDGKSAVASVQLQHHALQALYFWRYAIEAVQYWNHDLQCYQSSLHAIIRTLATYREDTPGWKALIAESIKNVEKPLIHLAALRTYVAQYQGTLYDDLDAAIPASVVPRYTKPQKIVSMLNTVYAQWEKLYRELEENDSTIGIHTVTQRLQRFAREAGTYEQILNPIRLPLLSGIHNDPQLKEYIRALQFQLVPQRAPGTIEGICAATQSAIHYLLPNPQPPHAYAVQPAAVPAQNTQASDGTIMTPRPYQGAQKELGIVGIAKHNIGVLLNNLPLHINALAAHVTNKIDRLSDDIEKPVQDIGAGIQTTKEALAWIKESTVARGSCTEDFLIPPLTIRTFDRTYIPILPNTADDPAIIAVDPACHATIADTYLKILKNHFRPYLKQIQTKHTAQKDVVTIEHIELTTNPDSNAILFVVAGVKKFQEFCKTAKNIPPMTDQCRLVYHYPEQSIDFLQNHKTTTVDPVIRHYDTVKKIIMQYPVLKEEPPYAAWIRTLESLDTIHYLSEDKRRSAIKNLFTLRAEIYEHVNKKEILYNSLREFLQKLQKIEIDMPLPFKQDEEKKQVDHNALLATLINNHAIKSETDALYNHFKAQYSEYTVASPLTQLFAYKAIPRLQKKLADEHTAKIIQIDVDIDTQRSKTWDIQSKMKSTPFTFLQPFWSWLYRKITGKEAYFETLQKNTIAAQKAIAHLNQQKNARELLRADITKPLQLQSPIDTKKLAPGIEGNIDSAIDGAFAAYERERNTPVTD